MVGVIFVMAGLTSGSGAPINPAALLVPRKADRATASTKALAVPSFPVHDRQRVHQSDPWLTTSVEVISSSRFQDMDHRREL